MNQEQTEHNQEAGGLLELIADSFPSNNLKELRVKSGIKRIAKRLKAGQTTEQAKASLSEWTQPLEVSPVNRTRGSFSTYSKGLTRKG